MSAGRYPEWVPETIGGFAEQQVASGAMPEGAARDYADRQFDTLLPDGLLTRDHHVWSAYDADVEVGYLWLRVREQAGEVEGYVFDVAVSPALRGHGYGRAIMLAGEDAARSLDVATMRLNVFGHNVAAQGLYRHLGYEAASTEMARRLDVTEPLTFPGGPVLRLEPMTREQFDSYRARAADDFARLLPDGLGTPEHHFWTGYDGDTEVGLVWLNISPRSDGLHAFGYDFLVAEELRRHGYGRAMIVAAERLCRDRGVVSLALDVFGVNHGARSLYEAMGFEVTATLMRKTLC